MHTRRWYVEFSLRHFVGTRNVLAVKAELSVFVLMLPQEAKSLIEHQSGALLPSQPARRHCGLEFSPALDDRPVRRKVVRDFCSQVLHGGLSADFGECVSCVLCVLRMGQYKGCVPCVSNLLWMPTPRAQKGSVAGSKEGYRRVHFYVPEHLVEYLDAAWRDHRTLSGELARNRSAYVMDLVERDRRRRAGDTTGR